MKKVILKTERLVLREFVPEDFEALYAILSDAETMRHYPKPFDEAKVRGWIEWNLENYRKYGFGLWAMELKETGEFLGDCGITMQTIDGEQLPEIGYPCEEDVLAARARQGGCPCGARLVLCKHEVRRGVFLHEIHE